MARIRTEIASPGADGERGRLLRLFASFHRAMSQASQTTRRQRALDHSPPDPSALESDVRSGIDNGEFWLAFQPQVSIHDDVTIGFEAFIRWNHPEHGLMEPSAFIPTLETLPMCRQLTDHVLDMGIAQLSAWRRRSGDAFMSVNLSARDTNDPALPLVVSELLDRHGVPARCLHLELTDGTALTNPEQTRSVLERLRDQGCAVAIDDFGIGFASVSYLTTLPVTTLKIDRSFVEQIVDDPRCEAIVRHSIDLGHALGLTVVAEGVETAAVLARLGDMHCDVAQGSLLAMPAPAAEVDLTGLRGGEMPS